MVWIFFPAWIGCFITILMNKSAVSSDAKFLGFSIVTAALIWSWQLYFVLHDKGGKDSGEN